MKLSNVDASAACAKSGARLCSVDELRSGITIGTGCDDQKFDQKFIWSAAQCGGSEKKPKFTAVRAFYKGGKLKVKQSCTANAKATVLRCCANDSSDNFRRNTPAPTAMVRDHAVQTE